MLQGHQRKYLRGLAHGLKPVVFIGHDGPTEGVVRAVDQALTDHELIKLKFNDHKDRKKPIAAEIAQRTGCELCGLIGHVAILYREHPDPDERRIELPKR